MQASRGPARLLGSTHHEVRLRARWSRRGWRCPVSGAASQRSTRDLVLHQQHHDDGCVPGQGPAIITISPRRSSILKPSGELELLEELDVIPRSSTAVISAALRVPAAVSLRRQPTNQGRQANRRSPGIHSARVISPPGPAPPRPPAAAPAASARPAPPRTAPRSSSPSASARRAAASPAGRSSDNGHARPAAAAPAGSARPAGPPSDSSSRPAPGRAPRRQRAPRTRPGASRSTSARRPRGCARPGPAPHQSAPRQYSSLCRQRPGVGGGPVGHLVPVEARPPTSTSSAIR